jgi:hypothetical protein
VPLLLLLLPPPLPPQQLLLLLCGPLPRGRFLLMFEFLLILNAITSSLHSSESGLASAHHTQHTTRQ